MPVAFLTENFTGDLAREPASSVFGPRHHAVEDEVFWLDAHIPLSQAVSRDCPVTCRQSPFYQAKPDYATFPEIRFENIGESRKLGRIGHARRNVIDIVTSQKFKILGKSDRERHGLIKTENYVLCG